MKGSEISPVESKDGQATKETGVTVTGRTLGTGWDRKQHKRRATIEYEYCESGAPEPKTVCTVPTSGGGVGAAVGGDLKKVNKKKGFSWNQYLLDERAKVASPKHFKNVCTTLLRIVCRCVFRVACNVLSLYATIYCLCL